MRREIREQLDIKFMIMRQIESQTLFDLSNFEVYYSPHRSLKSSNRFYELLFPFGEAVHNPLDKYLCDLLYLPFSDPLSVLDFLLQALYSILVFLHVVYLLFVLFFQTA